MNDYKLLYYIIFLVYYTIVLSGFFILLFRRNDPDRSLLVFFILYLAILISEGLCFFNPKKFGFLYHCEQLIEYTCLSFYCYQLLNAKRYKYILAAGSALFYSFFIYYYVCNSANFFGKDNFDSLGLGVLISIYSVLALMEIYLNDEILIKKSSFFWIIAANLIFYPGSLVNFGLREFLVYNRAESFYYINIYVNAFFNFILYTLYIKAFLCSSSIKRLG